MMRLYELLELLGCRKPQRRILGAIASVGARGLFDRRSEAGSVAGMGEKVVLEGELLREQAHLWRRYQSDLLSR
jgi:hypothetical protein